jgi:hypothetical protein
MRKIINTINTNVYHRVYFDIQEENLLGIIVNIYTETLTIDEKSKKSYEIKYHHRHYEEREYNKKDKTIRTELKYRRSIVEKVIFTDQQMKLLLSIYKGKLNDLDYTDFKKIGFIQYSKN